MTATSPLTRPRFAAVVAHADDAELLHRNLEHHLAIGFERVLVSLNLDDPASDRVAERWELTGRVRRVRLADYSPDPLDYFTAATGVVRVWCDPEWVAFIDTDEFWLPRTGRLEDTAALAGNDALQVLRYNAAVLRDDAGVDLLPDPQHPLLFRPLEGTQLQRLTEGNPYVRSPIAAKVMARAELIASVGMGGHEVQLSSADARTGAVDDLLVVHLPFTDVDRFTRKMTAVRVIADEHLAKFGPGTAAHWRSWLELDSDEAVSQEFARNVVPAEQVSLLREQGVLATPAELFAG